MTERAAPKNFRLEIFLISLAAILLEISMTRIFSFKLYYYFTYLILGIALLGLGAGGVFVAIFKRLRTLEPLVLVASCCLAASVSVPIAYLSIALIQVNLLELTSSLGEPIKLFLICSFLFLPFLLIGIILATIFGSRPEDMNRLYFADLVGAALGCGLCIPLFITLTPPGTVLVAGLVLAIAGLSCAAPTRRQIAVPCALVAILTVGGLLRTDLIPDPIPDQAKSMSPQKLSTSEILFSGWSSVFRVDVVRPSPGSKIYTLQHDGNIGSAIYEFDGDFSKLDRYDVGIRSKPFSVLGTEPSVLIIGSAGGQEILASLYLGAGKVTAVELNPVTVSLLRDEFAAFTGGIARDPRVTLINAEGRSFLERSREKYDLIWLVAPDSYAAMNAASSGAFVLSESYLYTVEMIEASLARLTDGGIICAQFGELSLLTRPNRTPRYVATAREAFARVGIEDFPNHIISSTGRGFLPSSTTLLSRDAFRPDQVARYRAKTAQIPKARMWHPLELGDDFSNSVTDIISLDPEALEAWYRTYPFNVRPVWDDSPFFWHFIPFWDATIGAFEKAEGYPDLEVATGERTLVALLAFAACFAGVFILLPIMTIRSVWREIPYKANVGIYFGALGLGFMFVEVCLIQKLTLFLGYPSYSLTVTLFGLLIFAGIGSLISVRYSSNRNLALGMLMGCLVLITLGLQFGLSSLTDYFVSASLAARVLITVVLLAPVGLCLGAFMPIGIATISPLSRHGREYIAWAWAINGFFSVVSSVLATMLSMTIGFRWVFFLALAIYAFGVAALSRVPAPSSDPAISPS